MKLVSKLRQVDVFFPGYSNKTDRHDIAEILLKGVLNTIYPLYFFLSLLTFWRSCSNDFRRKSFCSFWVDCCNNSSHTCSANLKSFSIPWWIQNVTTFSLYLVGMSRILSALFKWCMALSVLGDATVLYVSAIIKCTLVEAIHGSIPDKILSISSVWISARSMCSSFSDGIRSDKLSQHDRKIFCIMHRW